jgi:hypothetical protein
VISYRRTTRFGVLLVTYDGMVAAIHGPSGEVLSTGRGGHHERAIARALENLR